MMRVLGIVLVSVLLVFALAACKAATATSPTLTPSPTTVVTPEPTQVITPTPASTIEPTPTATPEPPSANPVPGSCAVFEEKYCNLGKVVEWEQYRFLAFKLPQGVAIFTPFDGIVTYPTFLLNPEAKAVTVHAQDRDFRVKGDFQAQKPNGSKAKSGEIIAFTTEQGIKVFEDYTVLISFGGYNKEQNKVWPDPDLLNEFFPSNE